MLEFFHAQTMQQAIMVQQVELENFIDHLCGDFLKVSIQNLLHPRIILKF